MGTGPELKEKPICTSEGWLCAYDYDAPGVDTAFIPATWLDDCKQLCVRHGFGGFSVVGGQAHFRQGTKEALLESLVPKTGATFYIRDEAASDSRFTFEVGGEASSDFRRLLETWVSGNLAQQLNATPEEVEALQWRSDGYAQGICARSQRAYLNFRSASSKGMGDDSMFTFSTQCADCGSSCGNWGCRGCRRPFCKKCFEKHR